VGPGRQTRFRDATLTPMSSSNDIPSGPATRPGTVDENGYAQLAALRAGIRRYLAWAEERAREHGMTPAQVQLALAVRSHADPAGPTVTELADTLLLRHHSVVGLVDRAELAGLVGRVRDPEHRSRVHVRLTPEGEERLQTLSVLHLEWLAEVGPQLAEVWGSFGVPTR
jgi:DNA-binding MarR family transcriptional regulator